MLGSTVGFIFYLIEKKGEVRRNRDGNISTAEYTTSKEREIDSSQNKQQISTLLTASIALIANLTEITR